MIININIDIDNFLKYTAHVTRLQTKYGKNSSHKYSNTENQIQSVWKKFDDLLGDVD